MLRFLLLFGLMLAPGLALACTNPTAQAGAIIFSAAAKAMQYCNGTNWVNTGPVIANAPQTGCNSPNGTAGGVIYNNTLGVVQFCNGSQWVNTACAQGRQLGGPGCGGKPAGTIQYVGGTINELQFCDSTDWVAMGYGCGLVQPLNVADVFSTDLYTGNGSTQTITNGIDLAGEGGVVVIKNRVDASAFGWYDTERGAALMLPSNGTNGNLSRPDGLTSFNPDGFNIGSDNEVNGSTDGIAAWTFRRAPKFFDVVTYTGNGVAGRTISHNLGVAPGMIVVKRRNSTGDWPVYHRSVSNQLLYLNATNAQTADFNGAGTNTFETFSENYHTSTTFGVGGPGSQINISGGTYVAYLFAHDPDPTGVIQCGSYNGNGSTSGPTVTLGWKPQYIIAKNATTSANWTIHDLARGPETANNRILYPNVSDSETQTLAYDFLVTGFQPKNAFFDMNRNGDTYIYCAIRAEGS